MKNLQLHGIYLKSGSRGRASVLVKLNDHLIAELDAGGRRPDDYVKGPYVSSIDTAIGYLIEDVVAEWLAAKLGA